MRTTTLILAILFSLSMLVSCSSKEQDQSQEKSQNQDKPKPATQTASTYKKPFSETVKYREVSDEQLQAYLAALKSASAPDEFAAAIENIGQVGPKAEAAIDDLAAQLNSGSAEVRMMAAWAIGRIGKAPEETIPKLITMLRDEKFYVRGNAAWALGRLNAQSAIESLAKLFEDPDTGVRICAAEAIGRIGGTQAVDILTEFSNFIPPKNSEPDPRRRYMNERRQSNPWPPYRVALRGLVFTGQDGIDTIMKHMRSGDRTRALLAAEALGKIGPDAMPTIMKAMDDDDVRIRMAAMHAIAEMGPDAADAVDKLISMLNTDMYVEQEYAVTALGKIGPAAAPAMDDLFSLLQRKSDYERSMRRHDFYYDILLAIDGIGPDKSRIPTLVKITYEVDPKIAEQVCRTLVKLGPEGCKAAFEIVLNPENSNALRENAYPILAGISSEDLGAMTLSLIQIIPKNNDGCYIMKILKRASPPPAKDIPELKKILNMSLKENGYETNYTALSAINALMKTKPFAKDILPTLLYVCQNGSRDIATKAAMLVCDFGPEAAPVIPELLAHCEKYPKQSDSFNENKTPTLAPYIAKKIGPQGIPYLIKVIKDGSRNSLNISDPSHEQAWMAAFILKDMGEPAMTVILKEMETADAAYLRLLLQTMEIIGPPAEAAVPQLIKLAQSDDETAYFAIKALTSIGPKAGPAAGCLIELLNKHDDNSQIESIYLARALAAIGQPAVPELIASLKDGHPNSALALGMIGPAAAEALESLVEKLPQARNDKETVLYLNAIGQIHCKSEIAIPAILAALPKTADGKITAEVFDGIDIRNAAREAIKAYGKTAIPEIIKALRKIKDIPPKDRSEHELAILSFLYRYLEGIKDHAYEAGDILVEFVAEEDQYAAKILRTNMGIGALPAYVKMRNNENANLRAIAKRIREKLLNESNPCDYELFLLEKFKASTNPEMAKRANQIFENLESYPRDLPYRLICDPLEGPDMDTEAVIWACQKIKNHIFTENSSELGHVINSLEIAVKDPRDEVREAAEPLLAGLLETQKKLSDTRRATDCDETPQWWEHKEYDAELAKKVPGPLKKLKSSNPSAVSEALQEFMEMGPSARDAVLPLVEMAADNGKCNPETIREILEKIGTVNNSDIPELIKILRNPDKSRAHVCAIVAIGAAGPAAGNIVPDIIEFIEKNKEFMYSDRNVSDYIAVVKALGRIGPQARDAIPVIIEKNNLFRPDESFRIPMVTLGRLSPAIKEAEPQLVEQILPYLLNLISITAHSLPDEDAIETLGIIGPPAHSAVPVLVKIINMAPLQKEEEDRRRGSIGCPWHIKKAAYDALTEILGRKPDVTLPDENEDQN